MAHKVHPKGFRLKETKDWESRWMGSRKKTYAAQLQEDWKIRTFLEEKLKEAGSQGILVAPIEKMIV